MQRCNCGGVADKSAKVRQGYGVVVPLLKAYREDNLPITRRRRQGASERPLRPHISPKATIHWDKRRFEANPGAADEIVGHRINNLFTHRQNGRTKSISDLNRADMPILIFPYPTHDYIPKIRRG